MCHFSIFECILIKTCRGDGVSKDLEVQVDSNNDGPRFSNLVLSSDFPVELGGTLLVIWDVTYGDRFPAFGNYDLFEWPGPLDPDNVFSSLELPPGAWDVSRLYTSGQITLAAQYRDDGDFDVDGQLTADDIDQLSAAVRSARDRSYDLNDDRLLNQDDRLLWVEDLKNTFFGDANLDGMVDAADLNALGLNWLGTGAVGWAEGDFTGDAIVNASDLNELALNWQAAVNPPVAAHTISEPTGISLALVGLFVCSFLRRVTSLDNNVTEQQRRWTLGFHSARSWKRDRE